jgi:hypothetical protein
VDRQGFGKGLAVDRQGFGKGSAAIWQAIGKQLKTNLLRACKRFGGACPALSGLPGMLGPDKKSLFIVA